jgi:hypothetical protein
MVIAIIVSEIQEVISQTVLPVAADRLESLASKPFPYTLTCIPPHNKILWTNIVLKDAISNDIASVAVAMELGFETVIETRLLPPCGPDVARQTTLSSRSQRVD